MEEASAVRPVDCEVDDRRRIAALRARRCAIQTELWPPLVAPCALRTTRASKI
jgi:hypothetical protein